MIHLLLQRLVGNHLTAKSTLRQIEMTFAGYAYVEAGHNSLLCRGSYGERQYSALCSACLRTMRVAKTSHSRTPKCMAGGQSRLPLKVRPATVSSGTGVRDAERFRDRETGRATLPMAGETRAAERPEWPRFQLSWHFGSTGVVGRRRR